MSSRNPASPLLIPHFSSKQVRLPQLRHHPDHQSLSLWTALSPQETLLCRSYRLHSAFLRLPSRSVYFASHSAIKAWALTSFFSNQWDFLVRGGPGATSSSAEIVLFISDDNTWSSLQVSYLISSRSDLFLGSFIADGFIF